MRSKDRLYSTEEERGGIAKTIVQIREKLKLSRLELACKIGCSQYTIDRYERADIDVPAFALNRILKLQENKK